MGLAYNLDVEYWKDVTKYLSEAIVYTPLSPQTQEGLFSVGPGGGWYGAWQNTADTCQAIYPTGEYIIRDAIFQNGMYIFCGSYKAFFRDLYGAGNDGYAWDGFLMVLRGYSNQTELSSPFLYDMNDGSFIDINSSSNAFGFVPMRMPLDIQPSAIGDAVTTAADDSVGLQAIDVYKNADAPFVATEQFTEANLKIITVGFQLVGDPVAQGMQFSTIDYVGFLLYGVLCRYGNGYDTIPVTGGNVEDETYRNINHDPVYVGTPVPPAFYTEAQLANTQSGSYVVYRAAAGDMFKTSWRAIANNSRPSGLIDPNLPNSEINLRDLDAWFGIAENQKDVGSNWNPDFWELGSKPNGDNPATGVNDPFLQSQASDWDYFPRRFMDVTAFSQTKYSVTKTYDSCFMIVGDCSVGLDVVGTAVQTVPMSIGGCYPNAYLELWITSNGQIPFDPADPVGYLGPYLIGEIAGLSAIAIATNPLTPSQLWTFPATMAPVSTFAGSYASFCLVPYEFMGPPFTVTGQELTALSYVALNGVVDGDGGTNSAIFATILFEGSVLGITAYQCLAVSGSVVSEAQTKMPTKWIGKATQTRTFTVGEESAAKGVTGADINPLNAEAYLIKNSNNGGELVGWKSNYQRYGLDGDIEVQEAQAILAKEQGQYTRQGFGFLGYKTGEGPTLIMFDSGGGLYLDANTIPVTVPTIYSNAILNEGNDLNKNTLPLTNPINTTRMALNCQWDNDRDQWLFCEQDPTLGTSIISVNSGFSASSNSNGYLDQSDNFGGAPVGFRLTDCHSSMFVPFLMTNNLDGIVLTGGDDPTSSGTGTQFDNTDLTKFGCYGINNGAPVATTFPSFLCADAVVNVQNNLSPFYNISGSTGRVAKVWVDYVLFDGADALIATKLRERGMKVTVEAVEWFKRKIINKGDLNIKQEEIEMWMRDQQDEFKQMMQTAERQGRVRKRKSQVSAYGLDLSEVISPDFEDKEVQEFMKEYLPQSRPPTPEEQRLEKQRKGGYSPEQNSYFDEIFED
jgi:hypothetical protein